MEFLNIINVKTLVKDRCSGPITIKSISDEKSHQIIKIFSRLNLF